MTPLDIITAVKEIVSPVYLVGGSVRDMLMGRTPKDYDFATPLEADEVEKRVKAAGRHVYAIGKKFGTIGFKIMDGKQPYYVEVTTYRKEAYTPGSRKPNVEFVTELKDDLSRRDFTMNAIAYDGENYIDPYGGRLDILERKIKAVGRSKDRFKEDPLRMLRAARFSAQLGFDIDPNMVGVARQMAQSIQWVSRERWVQEIDKLLLSPKPVQGLYALCDMHTMRYMLPEVYAVLTSDLAHMAPYHLATTTAIDALATPEAKPNADEMWALLLHCTGAPLENFEKTNQAIVRAISAEVVKGIAARLKFSNDRSDLAIAVASAGIKVNKTSDK